MLHALLDLEHGYLRLSVVLGALVALVALALIPAVILRRKEPSSTVAWILALVFLPGIGATLFLMFGRDRVRLPLRGRLEDDRALAERRRAELTARGLALPEAADPGRLERDMFRLGSALAGALPTSGNAVELLVDGEKTYEALGAAIDQATRSVYAEYFLVRNDATADWFAERLIAAARRGVAVKLLLDGLGCFWLRRRWLRSLREAGVVARFFLPARLIFFQPMNLRNHRKIVIVDGTIGFTGGINIGDEYRGWKGPWRDAHLRLEGPAVAELEHVFAKDWHFVTRTDPEVFPPPAPRGSATVAIVRSGPDAPGREREAIHRLLFSAITLARSRVLITTPYFIPDRAIMVALQTAAMRGVDVKLLFPSRSNHRVVFQAGRSFYDDLLEAGVEIYEYSPGMIHAKTMVVDGAIGLVGSANMDLRSFRLNFEVHAVLEDASTAAELEACFARDLEASRRIELDEFRRRSLGLRVIESAARLLSPLM